MSDAAVEDIVGGWRARGEILTVLNRKDDALAAYSRASQIAEQALGRNHRAALELLVAKADSFAYFQYTPEYIAAGEEAFRRVTAARGHLRPDTLLTQSERVYSLALVSAGRAMEALPIVRRVVEDTRRLDAGDTQRVGEAEWGLAVSLANLGMLDEAIPLMLHVIDHETRVGSGANAADAGAARVDRDDVCAGGDAGGGERGCAPGGRDCCTARVDQHASEAAQRAHEGIRSGVFGQ